MNKIKNSCFEDFIKNISITDDEENRLQSSHRNVREKLSQSDLNKNIVKSVLSGSYKKKTMVRTLDTDEKKTDVDVLVIFNFKRDQMNPYKLLSKVRSEIEEIQEYKGKTTLQKRSIGIELSKTHVDIIPVLEKIENSDKPLYISEPSKQNWEETDPLKSIEYFNAYASNKKNLRNIVKTLKWWKKINKPSSQRFPISYAFEILSIMYYVDDNNLFESMLKTYEKINTFLQGNTLKPILVDPCKNSNDLFKKMSQEDYQAFKTKFDKHTKQIRYSVTNNRVEDIRSIFGDKFPKCTIITEDTQNKLQDSTSHMRTYADK